jgi:FkbM family methyltransferase
MENTVKKRVLLFTPHLSTGGLPQVLVNKIQLLNDTYDLLVVEHHNHAWLFNIQRNRVINLIGEKKLITLREEDREQHFMDILNLFNPDTIYMEEFPEFFLEDNITSRIYVKDRTYKIIETTHDSSFPTHTKKWFPDKFVFVSPFNGFRYSVYDIPYEIVEYPVDFKLRDQEHFKEKLGLESDWKHVVNVGLFTARKNQGYIFEIAERLKDEKIKFHFIGNQAGNFKDYWEPLMNNKPENCVVWGERDDVYDFLQASDLFFFASKGDKNNKELNPIAIKEALEFKVPMLMYNLDVYCGKYDMYDNIHYLSGDIELDTQKLLQVLNTEKVQPKNIEKMNINVEKISLSFEPNENKIWINYIGEEPVNYKVSVRCMTSKAPIYWFNFDCPSSAQWWVMPVPPSVKRFDQDYLFRGFLIEFYDQNNNLVHSDTIVVNNVYPKLKELDFEPFDCSYVNYIEFFGDDIYRKFNLNDLDTVLDVGANVGLFAKYMYEEKNANKVILVEANPLLDNHIKLVLGEDYNRSKTYLTPLFGSKEKVHYKYSSTNSTIGTIVLDVNAEGYEQLDSVMELDTITLDEIIKENDLKRISLFKSDIEGGEYDLISSLTDEQMNMIDRFMVEFHANTGQLKLMVDKLERFGFECEFYKLDRINDRQTTIDEFHGVLITKSKKQEIRNFNTFTSPKEIEPVSASFYKEIFFDLEYERYDVKIEKGDTVIDLGAHVGIFTEFAISRNAGRIISFEKDEEIYSHLISNINDPRAVLLNKTIGKHDYTINNILNDHILSKIDFLKIDIEGYEYDLLFSTPDETFDKISKIAIEFHCWDYYSGNNEYYNYMLQIIDKLKSLGFLCTLDEVHKNSNLFMLYCKK